jgi:hypothetical protein
MPETCIDFTGSLAACEVGTTSAKAMLVALGA